MGREEPVQRVYPTHYFSSWVDLPSNVAHLRGVPELVAAALKGARVHEVPEGQQIYGSHPLLALFSTGVQLRGDVNSLVSDSYDEGTMVGIDQLLAIRVAQRLGQAPLFQRIDAWIPKVQPAAAAGARVFRDDLRVFLRAYGSQVPRLSLLPMLESCIGLGLTTILLYTIGLMRSWESQGSIPVKENQKPWPVFADCSQGIDLELRRLSEQSMDELLLQLNRLPVWFMCVKIAESHAREQQLPGFTRKELDPRNLNPDPTDRLNRLGEILNGTSEESRDFRRDTKGLCSRLVLAIQDSGNDDSLELVQILEAGLRHPAWNLAETIVAMMGDKLQGSHINKAFDSCSLVGEPHGLMRKRKSTQGRRRAEERRSIVLTNTMIDFLVHRHLRKAAKGTPERALSLKDFLHKLGIRYGILIDVAPPTMSVPNEMLRRNRDFLERRVRDLGLLIGANDAEAMKRLRSRFPVVTDGEVDSEVNHDDC